MENTPQFSNYSESNDGKTLFGIEKIIKEIPKLNEDSIAKVLDFAYEKAIMGFLNFDSAEELANSYIAKSKNGDKLEIVNSLIRWQNSKSFTSGFIAGLPGLTLLPVTLPANFASVLIIQLRMIASIAHIGGHDLQSDQVKTFVYMCLTGNGAMELVKKISVDLGQRIAKSTINKISGKTLTEINKRVGFRLLTKFGETGVINIGKAIPIIGGLIGGGFDIFTTNTIGNVARKVFIEEVEITPE